MTGPVLVIAGPTASGKSALALDAAVAFAGTVINADSMQVYRELRVLTARPSPEAEAWAPHRLFGVIGVGERCSAGRWLAMATAEIEAARAARRLPIVVGGTGLYLKALTEGLSPLPEVPEQVRVEARALHRRLGGPGFRDALAGLDPEMAARLSAGDRQRLMRAYEVVRATGRSLARWQREEPPRPALAARFATVLLAPPRQALYAAIDARFEAMLAAGALAEVAALAGSGLDASRPAPKALGLGALARHLRGEITLDEASEDAKRASRNYAKRQLTWFRHQMLRAEVINEQYSESLRPKIFSFIRRFLLTGPT